MRKYKATCFEKTIGEALDLPDFRIHFLDRHGSLYDGLVRANIRLSKEGVKLRASSLLEKEAIELFASLEDEKVIVCGMGKKTVHCQMWGKGPELLYDSNNSEQMVIPINGRYTVIRWS